MLNKMPHAPGSAIFSPAADLIEAMDDRAFRASYMAHHLRAFLADQIRNLRGERSQKAFGALIGKPQSVVSRLEDEDYGKLTLQSLIDVAAKLDVGLLVRYVDFPTFLTATRDFSQSAVAPPAYGRAAMTAALAEQPRADAVTAAAKVVTAGVPQPASAAAWQRLIARTPDASQPLLLTSLPPIETSPNQYSGTSAGDSGRVPDTVERSSALGRITEASRKTAA